MASLTDLPTELHLSIAEYWDPKTCFNFALTCHSHEKLMRSTLEYHADMYNAWGRVNACEKIEILWDTLKKVLLDRRIGDYIEELNIAGGEIFRWAEHNWASLEDIQLFTDAARPLRQLYPVEELEYYDDSGSPIEVGIYDIPEHGDFIQSLEDRIKCFEADAIAVVLVHYLPNLETITIDAESGMESFQILMQRISSYNEDPMKSPLLPFQRLKTVSVFDQSPKGCCSADWAPLLLCLPSLRTLAAYRMGNDMPLTEFVRRQRTARPRSSNVEELFFVECKFYDETLDVILNQARELKRFTYTGGSVLVSSALYLAKKVLSILSNTSSHSLEYLELAEDDYRNERDCFYDEETEIPSVDLKCFEKLRTLKCEWGMLVPEEWHKEEPGVVAFDVRSLLPASLENLYLDGPQDSERWQALVGPFDQSSPGTPLLSKYRIQRRSTRWRDEIVFAVGHTKRPKDAPDRELTKLFNHSW